VDGSAFDPSELSQSASENFDAALSLLIILGKIDEYAEPP
jgi:hypothetical protein